MISSSTMTFGAVINGNSAVSRSVGIRILSSIYISFKINPQNLALETLVATFE